MNDWSEAENRVERAYSLYESGKWAEALRELREAVRINPYNADWYYNMGLTLDAMYEYAQAIEAYLQALELSPSDVETLTALGVDSTRQKQFEQALRYFEQAQQIDPGFEPCYDYRIVTYSQMGLHDKAEEMFYLARQIKDKCAVCDYNMGLSLLARGKYDRAIACWQETLELDPEYPEVHARIAEAYWSKDDLDRAESHFGLAVRDDPGNIDVLLDYGSMLLNKQEVSRAAEKFSFVLELEPGNLSARACLGEIALLRDKPGRAAKLLEGVLAEDGGYPLVNLHLGICYMKLGLVEHSRERLLAEWATKPTDKSVLLGLGRALLEVGQAKTGAACLGRLLQLAENEASAHHGFGAACLQIGLVDGAVEHCRRAVELEPRLIEAHCDLTVGYFRQGRWWKALKQVWGIVRLSAGNSQLRRRVLGGLERRLIRSRKR